MATYAERHDRALSTLAAMLPPGADPERTATAMARRHGALGSYAIDYVMGDVWSRPQLSRRDRSLVVLAFLATLRSDEELATHTRFGLANGLGRAEVEEVVLQVAGYAGFPTALPAARVVDEVFRALDGVERLPARAPAEPKDDRDRLAGGAAVLHRLTGGRSAPDPAEALQGIQGGLGDVGSLALTWAFGELWSRDALSRRDRSLVVVAILVALARSEELKAHVRGALAHGVTRTEVEEVMVQACVYCGFPRAVEGIRTARAVFARLDRSH